MDNEAMLAAQQMVAAREAIGWTRRGLSARIGCPESTLRKMEAGKIPPPPQLVKWLKLLAEVHEKFPKPDLAGTLWAADPNADLP